MKHITMFYVILALSIQLTEVENKQPHDTTKRYYVNSRNLNRIATSYMTLGRRPKHLLGRTLGYKQCEL